MNKRPLPKESIYYLFDGGEIVYIGKSKNVLSRIGSHVSNKKIVFDSYAINDNFEGESRIFEILEIRKYKPKYNGNFENKYKILNEKS